VIPWYRLGYLAPHRVVDTLPYQFYQVAPPGMMLAVAGIDLEAYTRQAADAGLTDAADLLDEMARRRVDRIAIAGVPLAAALGRDAMRRRLVELSERTGVVVDTDLEAIVAAMQHLGSRRVAIATRWTPEVNAAVAAYLAAAGVEVIAEESRGRSLTENAGLGDADGMQLALDLGRAVLEANPSADGLLLPGLRWIAVDAVRTLEAELGRPVYANVICSTWAALRAAGWRGTAGPGRLLETLAEPT